MRNLRDCRKHSIPDIYTATGYSHGQWRLVIFPHQVWDEWAPDIKGTEQEKIRPAEIQTRVTWFKVEYVTYYNLLDNGKYVGDY